MEPAARLLTEAGYELAAEPQIEFSDTSARAVGLSGCLIAFRGWMWSAHSLRFACPSM